MLESLPFLDEIVGYMNALGWDVHSFDHEDGNGQFEFDFSYTDAIAMADRFMLFRMMAKQVARKYGYEATFMPKPWSDRTGGGGALQHVDVATWRRARTCSPTGDDTARLRRSPSSATGSWPACSPTPRRSARSPPDGELVQAADQAAAR